MGAFSIWHIVVIAIVAAFLFFGWKQLPDMARSFGRSLRVFKTEIKGMTDDDKAREDAKGAEQAQPRQLAPRPAPVAHPAPAAQPAAQPAARPAARAEVVRNGAAPAAPATARPRPTPSPNGRARG